MESRLMGLALLVAFPILGMSPLSTPHTRSRIAHLVVVVQENHSFDSYFGKYCQAPAGSAPQCTSGAGCCEAGPLTDPGTGKPVLSLTEQDHKEYDPPHSRDCEEKEMNGGKMDAFISTPGCGDARNFAYAEESAAGTYWNFARRYAMGDRVFQSIAGASSANDMYYATARFVFNDNEVFPKAIGQSCVKTSPIKQFSMPHIGELLSGAGVPWSAYAEGYDVMVKAQPGCPGAWPNFYDASDVPFTYFKGADDPATMKDFTVFKKEVDAGTLPSVTFIRALGTRSEHPGGGITMRDGMDFVADIHDLLQKSPRYAEDTLMLVTPDESGGYFDHVAPPPASVVDAQPYGPRIYLFALGRFAKRDHVSHVRMEHSSILRFIEWNWLAGEPGQLRARDAVVNGIGSLLDPREAGIEVP